MPIASRTTETAPVLPLFAQVESELRQRIVSNQLEAGSKLSSEAELEAEFGVSRITVRQALATLHAEGLIRKINGRGSFVTRPGDAPRLGPLSGFYEHMRAHGREAHGKVVSVRQVAASAAIAQALHIAPGDTLTAITTVRTADGHPLAYSTAVGAPGMMKTLLREELETNDVLTLLETRLGFRLKNIHTESSAEPAGKTRARHLEMDERDPVLRVRMAVHDVDDRPLMYADTYFRGDAFSYKAVIRR